MKKKVIIALLALTVTTGSFISCSTTEKVVEDTKNTVEKGTEMTKDALEKAKEMITGDNTEGTIVENYTDNKKVSDYNLENFKADMEEKGYEVEIISKDKDFFDSPKFEVKFGEENASAYDYEDMSTLEKDLSAITENGLAVSGTKLNWSKTPHYYKKGELLIIYDGDNTETINTLDEVLGSELYK